MLSLEYVSEAITGQKKSLSRSHKKIWSSRCVIIRVHSKHGLITTAQCEVNPKHTGSAEDKDMGSWEYMGVMTTAKSRVNQDHTGKEMLSHSKNGWITTTQCGVNLKHTGSAEGKGVLSWEYVRGMGVVTCSTNVAKRIIWGGWAAAAASAIFLRLALNVLLMKENLERDVMEN